MSGAEGSLDTWLVLSAAAVLCLQAGLVLLEVGAARAKNAQYTCVKAGCVVGGATVAWYAVGFGVAFGGAGQQQAVFAIATSLKAVCVFFEWTDRIERRWTELHRAALRRWSAH